MPRGRRGEHQFQGCCSGPLTLPPQAARADTPPLIKPFRFGQQETSIEDVTLTQETVPQTPEDQCLDLGVRLHKAHMSPQRLRTAQCCESCAPARSHPSTRGQDVLSSSLPTPRCRRPKPRHHLRSKSRSGPQQSRGNRPPKAGAPTCGPFSFPRERGWLPVPSWDLGGGTLAVRARLAHPSRAPEAVPSPVTGQYLVGFQLCSVAYERHVPPPPAAAQKPSRERKVNPVSSLGAQPSASEGGPKRAPPSRRVPGGARALPSEHFPRPWRPQTRGASISPRHKLRPLQASPRPPTGSDWSSQPTVLPSRHPPGTPHGRGHPGAELPRGRSHLAYQDFVGLPTLWEGT